MRKQPESAKFVDENPNEDTPLAVGAPVRVGRLKSAVSVRAELGRLYREARRREGRFPDAQTAQRLANVLNAIRQAIESEDLEARVRSLETRAAKDAT
jgi:hypothetical protein